MLVYRVGPSSGDYQSWSQLVSEFLIQNLVPLDHTRFLRHKILPLEFWPLKTDNSPRK